MAGTLQNYRAIEKRLDRGLSYNDYDSYLILVDGVKTREDNLDHIETIADDLKIAFKESRIDIERKTVRNVLEKIADLLGKYIEVYEEDLKFIKKNRLESAFGQLSAKFIMRHEDVVDELEDLIENINLSLNYTKELKELETVSEKYARVAPVVTLDKWCEKT